MRTFPLSEPSREQSRRKNAEYHTAGAEGSTKADFVHTIVDHEVTQTLAYLERLKKAKGIDAKINRMVLHLVSESYINTLLEPIRHNMSYEEAIENLDFLAVFYTGAGKVFSARCSLRKTYDR